MTSKKQFCADCGRFTFCCMHHEPPRSLGGGDLVPLCFLCHVVRHRLKGDWVEWGRKGGKRTASNSSNWKKNLKQFRGVR